jgi:hypothetical protein
MRFLNVIQFSAAERDLPIFSGPRRPLVRVAARQMRINPRDVIGRPPVSIRNAAVPRALPAAGGRSLVLTSKPKPFDVRFPSPRPEKYRIVLLSSRPAPSSFLLFFFVKPSL